MSGTTTIADWLSAPVAPLAWCWRVERRDGVTIGLTTHDRDLTIDGLVFRSAPGMRPSAVRQAMGLEGDRMDIEGALTIDGFADADLVTGRWDAAQLSLLVADWEEPDRRHFIVAEGRLGEVAVAGRGFTAELRGRSDWLDEAAAVTTSPGCRAELGDRQCRVALAAWTRRARVLSVDLQQVTLDSDPGPVVDGTLRWLDGPATGLRATIIAQNGATITLADPPRLPVAPPAPVEIMVGCDKRATTCQRRFDNIVNFRGEPHLPGTDLLTRYPGG